MLATAGPRSIESAALLQTAAQLQAASENAKSDFPAFIAALSRNLTLWTLLAADAARPDNALPQDLRSAVMRLAAFVREQTLRLQRNETGAEVAALIEINRNIAAGLGQPASSAGRR